MVASSLLSAEELRTVARRKHSSNPVLSFGAGKLEDRMSMYFCELLKVPEVLAQWLSTLPVSMSPDHLPALDVQCQMRQSGLFPDLTVSGTDLRIHCEVKLWTGLGERQRASGFRQLQSYANDLVGWRDGCQTRRAALVLLGPSSMRSELYDQGLRQLEQLSIDPTRLGWDSWNDLRWQSWEDVATMCRQLSAQAVGDARLRVHLDDYALLINELVGGLMDPLDTVEESSLRPKRLGMAIAKTLDVLRLLYQSLRDESALEVKSVGDDSDWTYVGASCHIDGEWVVWFGFWPEAWEVVGTPLALQLRNYDDSQANALTQAHLDRPLVVETEDGDFHAVPMPIEPDTPLPQVATKLKDRVMSYLRTLASTRTV